VELCFGDIYIAKWCKSNNLEYFGFDINPHFVDLAKRRGYSVKLTNLRNLDSLSFPMADVVIMMGSLYHFHDVLDRLVNKVMESSPRFIISEPIKNLSSRDGLFGSIARNSANAGLGDEVFRFNEKTLIEKLNEISKGKYNISILSLAKDAIVEIRRI
jgi:hypothetical protein